MSHELNVLIANCSDVPRYTYEIHHYEGPIQEGYVIKAADKTLLYKSDGSLASDFGAMGIIYREVYQGKKVLILKNASDEVEIDKK